MSKYVTTRRLAMLMMVAICSAVGASGCATTLVSQLPLETPLVSEEAAVRIEIATAAGIPVGDVEEIEAALEELREIDEGVHAEQEAKWNDVVAGFKDSDKSKWFDLKRIYLASIRHKRDSLIDSSDRTKSWKDKPSSTQKASRARKRAEQELSATKKPPVAEKESSPKTHVARREESGSSNDGRAKSGRKDISREASRRERDRRGELADRELADRDETFETGEDQKPRGWFYEVKEGPRAEGRRIADRRASGKRDTDKRDASYQRDADRRATRPVSYSAEERASYNDAERLSEDDRRSKRFDDRSYEADSSNQQEPVRNSSDDRSGRADDQWRDQLAGAIRKLESKIESEGDDDRYTDNANQDEAILRLLYLADGRYEAAVRPLSSDSLEEREFWSSQFYGLSLMLDDEHLPNVRRRATEAIAELRKANRYLGSLADLTVSNMTFCRRVTSFGIFEEFDEFEFAAGQTTLVYVELENYRSEDTARGQRISFGGSYQIYDSHGHTWADRELAEYEEHAKQSRRDFFLHYRIAVPQQLPPGEYTLQLSIEDNVSHQIAQSQIQFEVVNRQQTKSTSRR